MKIEKIIYSICFIIAAIAGPAVYYFSGANCLKGYLIGFTLALISFYSVIQTSYLLVPEDRSVKPGVPQKLMVAAMYIIKICLFVLAIWFLSSSGNAALAGFIGGFSTILPALLTGGLLFRSCQTEKPLQPPSNK